MKGLSSVGINNVDRGATIDADHDPGLAYNQLVTPKLLLLLLLLWRGVRSQRDLQLSADVAVFGNFQIPVKGLVHPNKSATRS